MDDQFDGHTVLVTGAAGNIGRAVSVLLASLSARVVAADLPSAADELAETVALCGDGARSVTFDVTDQDDVDKGFAAAEAEVGLMDLVFNNAGYQGHFANTLDYDGEDFRRVLDINVTGVFTVLQAAGRAMVAAGTGGAIVNTASMAAVGAPNMAAYSASKAAVIGLTKTAALDLAPNNIRVNAISPAFIGPGAMWDRQVELQAETPSQYYGDDAATVADQMIGLVPLRRYGSLMEVAEVVAFLLSPRSSYLTGTNTEIAGGAS